MFFGNINNLAQDCKALPEAVVKGLEYLKNTDFSKGEVGNYEIEGSQIVAMVQEHQTSPKEQRRAEAHARNIDIQFVIEGSERIGFGLADPANEVQEDLLEPKDAIFFKTVKDEMDLLLTVGNYVVFFPGEVHRPCCQWGENTRLRKVVVKIDADLL